MPDRMPCTHLDQSTRRRVLDLAARLTRPRCGRDWSVACDSLGERTRRLNGRLNGTPAPRPDSRDWRFRAD